MQQPNVVRNVTLASMLMLMIMLVGCFGGGPKDSDIKNEIIAELHSDGADQIRSVVNFAVLEKIKTDDSHYKVKVGYDLKFNMSFAEFRAAVAAESRQAKMSDRFESALMVSSIKDMFGEFKKGDLAHQEDEIIYAKSDNGWKKTQSVE